MKSKPTKKTTTFEDAQELMNSVCEDSSRLKEIEATIEVEQQGIAKAYEQEINELNEKIAANKELLKAYAEANQGTWPKKQLAFLNGTIGFKTAPHKLVLPDGKSWDDVVKYLSSKFPEFTVVNTEVDKKAIITARDSKEVEKICKATGLSIEQEENFYCKPKAQQLKAA